MTTGVQTFTIPLALRFALSLEAWLPARSLSMMSMRAVLVVLVSAVLPLVAACSSSSDGGSAAAGAGGSGGGAGGAVAGNGGTDTGAGGDAAGAAGTGAGGAGGDGSAGAGGAVPEVDVSTCTLADATDMTADAAVTIGYDASGANAFSPKCILVKTGTTVTLPTRAFHPLAGMVKNGTQPNPITDAAAAVTPPAGSMPADVPVTFTSPGTYGFYCQNHGSDLVGTKSGMSGGIYVQD